MNWKGLLITMEEWHAFLIGLGDSVGVFTIHHSFDMKEYHYYCVGRVVGHHLPYLFILGLGILIGRLI